MFYKKKVQTFIQFTVMSSFEDTGTKEVNYKVNFPTKQNHLNQVLPLMKIITTQYLCFRSHFYFTIKHKTVFLQQPSSRFGIALLGSSFTASPNTGSFTLGPRSAEMSLNFHYQASSTNWYAWESSGRHYSFQNLDNS